MCSKFAHLGSLRIKHALKALAAYMPQEQYALRFFCAMLCDAVLKDLATKGDMPFAK